MKAKKSSKLVPGKKLEPAKSARPTLGRPMPVYFVDGTLKDKTPKKSETESQTDS
jgi:hypothetical protein